MSKTELKTIDRPADFLEGQLDCMKGKPAQADRTEDYTRGYATQYQHEANMDAMTDG